MNATSQSTSSGLNSYNSLNRAVRIKDMARIVEDNKIMLRKLQGAASCYSIDRWNQDDKKKKKLVKMICRNSDRFLKNPYFLCNGLPNTSLGTANSEHSFYGFGAGTHFQDDKRSMKKRSSYTSLDPVYQVPQSASGLGRQTYYPMSFVGTGNSTIQTIEEYQRGRPMSAPKYGRRLRNKGSKRDILVTDE